MQKLCVFHLAAKTGNAQIAEGISEQMQIETFAVFTLGQAAISGFFKFWFCHRAAINRAAVVFHPVSEYLQSFFRTVIQIASGGGADVHQQVTAAGNGIDKQADEHFGRFPGLFISEISPGAGKGVAGFPGNELAGFFVAYPLVGLVLFGCPEILINFCAVVDDDMGLQGACSCDQLFCLPVVLTFAFLPCFIAGSVVLGIREVKPKDVNLTVVG